MDEQAALALLSALARSLMISSLTGTLIQAPDGTVPVSLSSTSANDIATLLEDLILSCRNRQEVSYGRPIKV